MMRPLCRALFLCVITMTALVSIGASAETSVQQGTISSSQALTGMCRLSHKFIDCTVFLTFCIEDDGDVTTILGHDNSRFCNTADPTGVQRLNQVVSILHNMYSSATEYIINSLILCSYNLRVVFVNLILSFMRSKCFVVVRQLHSL